MDEFASKPPRNGEGDHAKHGGGADGGGIADLFNLPFTELVFRAAEVHRLHAAGEVQLCTLLPGS